MTIAMNRRGFLQMLGAGAAVTAAGLIVPDVARKIFLPPKGGWTGTGLTESELSAAGLNVGDVLTFEGVYDPPRIRRCKQFVVTSVTENGAIIDPHEAVCYDAVWTTPDGEEHQYHCDARLRPHDTADTLKFLDDTARSTLERIMRGAGGRPGATRFKLELPRSSITDARYI